MTSFFHPLDRLEIGLSQETPVIEEITQALRARGVTSASEFLGLRWFWWHISRQDLLKILPDVGSWTALQSLLTCISCCAMAVQPGCIPQRNGSAPRLMGGYGACELPTALEKWGSDGPFSALEGKFHESLVEGGVPRKLALAFVGAFYEMASNAVEHANSPVEPVASFEVNRRYWSFGITDVGRGVLGSIRENPCFAALEHESDALETIMRDGVSRTGEPGRGRGFSQVFKAFVDRRSRLRFRSGSAVASWEGKSPTAQEIAIDVLPVSRFGFHIGVAGPLPQRRR